MDGLIACDMKDVKRRLKPAGCNMAPKTQEEAPACPCLLQRAQPKKEACLGGLFRRPPHALHVVLLAHLRAHERHALATAGY